MAKQTEKPVESAPTFDCILVQCTAVGPYQRGQIVPREAIAAWADPDRLIATDLAAAHAGPPNCATVPPPDVRGRAVPDVVATGEFSAGDLAAAHRDLMAAHDELRQKHAELHADYEHGKAESEKKVAELTAAHEKAVADLAERDAELAKLRTVVAEAEKQLESLTAPAGGADKPKK